MTALVPCVLLPAALAAAQVRTEPPERWWGSRGVRVTVEVEEERRREGVRFAYRVRNLSEPTDDAYPGVARLVVAGPSAVAAGALGSVVVESPPGWEAQVLPGDPRSPIAWRVSWTCAQKDVKHVLQHGVLPGRTLGGFRVSIPDPDAEYVSAPYAVYLVASAARFGGWHALEGRPFRVRPRR
jgi:hypothetical protein